MLESEHQSVQATLDAFVDGLRRLDWERMRETFSADASLFFPFENEPRRVEGIAAIEAAFRAFFATRADADRLDVQPLDVTIQVMRDAAIVTFHLARRGAVGRRTLVLRRDAGRWRIAHLHASVVSTTV